MSETTKQAIAAREAARAEERAAGGRPTRSTSRSGARRTTAQKPADKPDKGEKEPEQP